MIDDTLFRFIYSSRKYHPPLRISTAIVFAFVGLLAFGSAVHSSDADPNQRFNPLLEARESIIYSVEFSRDSSSSQEAVAERVEPAPIEGANAAYLLQAVDTIADDFSGKNYSNSTGSQPWLGSWTEVNDDGKSDKGEIKIDKGKLEIEAKNGGPLIYRDADLSSAAVATLLVEIDKNEVDKNSEIVLEVSNNGGASFTTLETYDKIGYGTETYDLIAALGSLSANTRIQFRIAVGDDDKDKLKVDAVTITYSTVAPTDSSVEFITSGGVSANSFDVRESICLRVIDGDEANRVSVSVTIVGGAGNPVFMLPATTTPGRFETCLPANTFGGGDTLLASYTDIDDISDTATDIVPITAQTASTTLFITSGEAETPLYNQEEEVCVRVLDPDETGEGDVTVNITGGGGNPSLNLSETATAGRFEGCFASNTFADVTLTATYTDDDTGSDSSNDTATVLIVDDDNDGVSNLTDVCPNTPGGGIVDVDGCGFDTDLRMIKSRPLQPSSQGRHLITRSRS